MPACEAYHLPEHIRKHIDYITPGIKLLAPAYSSQPTKSDAALIKERSRGLSVRGINGRLRTQIENVTRHDANDLSTCWEALTPACIAALYNITKGTLKSRKNSIAVFESELQFYTQKDLDIFFTGFASYIPNGTHPKAANIDGGQQATKDPYSAYGEANLDIQCVYPIIYPQEVTLYQVDDFIVQANQLDTYTFGFNTFLDALDGVRHILCLRIKCSASLYFTVVLYLLSL